MRKLMIPTLMSVLSVVVMAAVSFAGDWYCDTAPCPCDFDWQWFAPLHDVCCEPNPEAREGYFFTAEAAHYWILKANRQPIGNAGRVVAWLPNSVNYIFTDINTTTLPNGLNAPNAGNSALLSLIWPIVGSGSTGFQFNGIDDSQSRTMDGKGNRFEFGRVHDDCGWMISIIDRIKMNLTDNYGFDDKRINQLGAAQGLPGIDGIPDLDGAGPGAVTNPVAPVPGIQALLHIDGLLTVPVLFNDPLNLLLGFEVDVGQNPIDLNGDGVIDDRDLTRIAVVFDDVSVQNQSFLSSVELVGVRRKRRLHSGFDLDGYLGARYIGLDDRLNVTARGGVLADSDWQNRAENWIVGPEVGFRASRQHRRWITTVHAKFLAGANFLTIRQNGTLGSHLTVGAPGVPRDVGGNTFFHRFSDERFSPVGEFRFETACQMTRSINFRAGWNALVIGNVARGSNTIAYDFPQLGIRDEREEAFTHGITVGFDINR